MPAGFRGDVDDDARALLEEPPVRGAAPLQGLQQVRLDDLRVIGQGHALLSHDDDPTVP